MSEEKIGLESKCAQTNNSVCVVLDRSRQRANFCKHGELFKAIIEVHNIFEWIAENYPGVVVVGVVDEDISAIKIGKYGDLIAEHSGGGPADGDLDEEQA